MMYPPPPPLPSRPQPQRLYRTMTSHRPSTTSLFHWKVILLPILLFVPSCGCITTTTTTTAVVVVVILMGRVVPSLWMTDAAIASKGVMNDDFQIDRSDSDENDNIIDFDDEMIQTSILHYMNDNDDDEENHCHASEPDDIDYETEHNHHDTDDATDVQPEDDDDDLIQTFHSIHEVYHRLQQQQQQQQQSSSDTTTTTSIYWMILLLQDDDCSTTHPWNSDMMTLYRRAAQQIVQWNDDWYPHHHHDTSPTNSTTTTTMDVPYIHIGQFYLQSDRDKEIITSQLGIVTTPTIVLVSTTPMPSSSSSSTTTNNHKSMMEYGPIYVMEYTGIISTSIGMAQGIRHYFDTISPLRSQLIDTVVPMVNATNPLVLMEPRHFPSIQHLQQYVRIYASRLFVGTTTTTTDTEDRVQSNQWVLSKETTSPEERLYIHWLLGDDDATTNNNNIDDNNDNDYVLLILQCRLSLPQETDDRSSTSPNDWYKDFDTMARTLQARRDILFFVVQQQQQPPSWKNTTHDAKEQDDAWCTSDGSVWVYEIPYQSTKMDETKEFLSKPPTEWDTNFVSYYFDSNAESMKHIHNNHTRESRLVEFLVKVCTNTVLWFDRQLVAPMAFPTYRKIHAVLFIDMHHDLMYIATETYHNNVNMEIEADEYIATNTTLLLNDNPRSLMNRRSVTDFRRTCRKHRVQHSKSLLDDDIVCLIIPSTETRILTTFGVTQMWNDIDDAIASFTPEKLRQQQERNGTVDDFIVLPQLLITDQRYGGTRRYYKDLVPDYNTNSNQTDHPIDEYVTKFWNDELDYVIKSGVTPMKEKNQYGVHILTANTIVSKLYRPTESTTNSNGIHALVLFTTSTCGHCKRISIIWNRLSHVLQTIGWDTWIQVYQVDVSENDVMSTPLNVTIEWVPDVYYLSPDRTKRIRYSQVDELGDTIGSVRDPIEIIDWLIHDVGHDFIDTKGIEQLLSDLEEY